MREGERERERERKRERERVRERERKREIREKNFCFSLTFMSFLIIRFCVHHCVPAAHCLKMQNGRHAVCQILDIFVPKS